MKRKGGGKLLIICMLMLLGNSLGSTIPAAPSDITVRDRTTNSMNISWTQNGTTDDCEVNVDGTDDQVSGFDCDELTAEITGLPIAGKEYNITVTAILVNETSSNYTMERTRPPQPELTYQTGKTTTDSIFLNVSVPGDETNCEVNEVTVNCDSCPDSPIIEEATCGTSVKVEVFSLTPGTEYTFTATATSGETDSEDSDEVTGPTAPSAPEIESIDASTNSLEVNWKQPNEANTNLTKQVVGWACGGATNSSDVGKDATSYTIDRLTPGTQCDVTVTVFTSYNDADYSNSSTLQQWTIPDAPKDIIVKEESRTTDSMSISWTQDGDTNGCEVTVDGADDESIVDTNCTTHTSDITGLPIAGKEYTITVTAKSGNETNSTETMERTRPPQPELTYRTNETTESVIVLDVMPGNGNNCEVNEVTVNCEGDSCPDSPITKNATCGTSVAVEVDGLIPGTNYTFTANATSGKIDSEESAPLTGPTAPSAPEIESIDASINSLEVNWKQPNEANTDLTKQVVGWACGGATNSSDVGKDAASYTIKDLTPGTPCDVTVTVFTSYNDADYSNSSIQQQWTLPAAPSNITVTGRTTETMSIRWNQDGNAENCTVTVPEATSIITNCTARTADISGLPSAGKEYTITVTAISGGEENFTDSQQRTLPPKPELTYKKDNTTENSIFLDVVVPGNGTNCAVNNVTVEASGSTSETVEITTCGNLEEVEMKGLIPGTAYTFTATATSGGIHSEKSNDITGPTVPSAPVIESIDASTNSLQVNWTQPDGTNADITKQEVGWTCGGTPDSLDKDKDATSHTIKGLTPGTQCEVTVTVFTNYTDTDYSNSSTQQQWTNGKVPENVTVTTATTSSLAVKWDDPNRDTSHYLLNCTCNKPECSPYGQKIDDGAKTGECIGLTPGTEYEVKVTAVVNGTQHSAEPEDTLTKVAKPTDVTIAVQTIDSLTVSWELEGGSNTSTVMCGDIEGEVKDDEMTAVCSGLTPGSVYNVTVTAAIDDDKNSSAPKPGYTVASSPTNFTVSTESDTTLQAEWESPIGGCQEIKLTYYEHNSLDTEGEITVACDEMSVDLVNLTGNGLYTVMIETIHPEQEGDNSALRNNTGWTLPSTVSSLNVSSTSDTSITLTWSFPDGNVQENNLSRYVLTVKLEDTCVQQITFSEDGLDEGPEGCEGGDNYNSSYDRNQTVEYTVTELDPCNEYEFNVYAENDGGEGEGTDKSEMTDVGEPTSQSVITSAKPGIENVLLKWTLPTDPANCSIVKSVIKYTYKNCSTDATMEKEMVVDGNATSITVEGLQAYWNYSFIVTSNTSAGAGISESEAVTNQTLHDTPGPPTNVKIVEGEVTHEKINVSWSLPDPCERNGVITGYNVSWTYVDPMYPEDLSKGGDGSDQTELVETYVITAKPYKNYTIMVSAINGAGQGMASQQLKQQTNEWVGGTVSPSSIEFDTSIEYAINVTWEAPLEPQGVITHYTVVYRSLGFPCDTYDTLTCSGEENVTDGRSVNLTGLQPAQEFEFNITSWTSVGEGEPAERTNTTITAKPLTPTGLNVIATDAETLSVSWTKPEHYPGDTSYTVNVTDTVISVDSKTATVQGYENVTVTVSGLDPYWHYTVSITADTEAGESDPTDGQPIQMPEADPRAVEDFNVTHDEEECTAPKLDVAWTKLEGKDRRGDIQNYTVIFWDVKNTANRIQVAFKETIDEDTTQEEELTEEDHGIKTETTYKFEIVAYSNVEHGDVTALKDTVYCGACAPKVPEGEEIGSTNSTKTVKDGVSQSGVNRKKQFRIQLDGDFFSDPSNGEIIKRGVYVLQDGEHEDAQTEIITENELLEESWYNAMEDKTTIKPYRVDLATPAYYIDLSEGSHKDMYMPWWERAFESATNARRKIRSVPDDVEVVIGKDGTCGPNLPDNMCNGELPDGREYRVRVFVCTNGGCTVTSSSEPIGTEKDQTGMIVGTVMGVLCLLALVVLIVLLLDWRGIISIKGKPKEEGRVEEFVMPQTSATPQPETFQRNRPVPIDMFIQHVTKLHRDSNFAFAKEYQDIKDHSADKPKTAAELQANRAKNRYVNILPFDDTRVKLLPVEDEEGSDYINGNFMMGINSKREFMTMQGPLGCTSDDFWRAIWEQNVSLIVMVTKCKEREREKCDQYWPEQRDEKTKTYGDVQVTVRSESFLGDYVIRVIDLQMNHESRTLKQYHFLSWPDFGCPDTTDQLLNFVTVVRSDIRPNLPGPILVHCSAGVGRTGTFIVVDRVLQAMRRGEDIDIFGIVLEMRENRVNMVQTEDQYVYIHDCIQDAIIKKMHLPPNERESEQHIYSNEQFVPDEPEENMYENFNPEIAAQLQGNETEKV